MRFIIFVIMAYYSDNKGETPMWALPLLFFILGAILAMLFVLIYKIL